MIFDEDESRVLLDPKISFVKLDEIEGRWLDPVFKEGENLVGVLNADVRYSLEWLPDLEEEWW